MVNLADSSVPDWAEQTLVADIDRTGRVILAVGVGSTAGPIMTGWQQAARSAGIGWRPHSYDSVSSAMAAVYGCAARVGFRLMITGTGADCAALRSAALELGWLDEEIRIGSTDTAQRRVSCPHCSAITLAEVAIEQVVRCEGCGRTLIVHDHFSRRIGTYLGSQVDAEDGAIA